MSTILRIVAVGVVGWSLTAVPAEAQSARGWRIQWEQLRMDVSGADEHVGDAATVTEVATLASPPQITDKVTHEGIGLDLKAGNAFRALVEYRGERWSVGASGWRMSSTSSVSGRVTSAAEVLTATTYTSEVKTVLMWNELLFPVRNDLEPSGLSPVEYGASGALETFAVDAYARMVMATTTASRLDLIVGAKVASVRASQDQYLNERAFVLNRFRPLHLNNDISLSSAASGDVDGVGPMVGLAEEATWRRLQLEASATVSAVYATADQSGAFTDIDAVTLAQSATGPFAPCPIVLADLGCYSVRSDWTFSESGRTLIPVTELRLAVLVDVTRHIAVGGTSFVSLWSGVPAPPRFTMSHAEAGPGLDWELPQRSLRFGSAGLVVRVGF